MYAEILQAAAGDHGAHDIRQRADARSCIVEPSSSKPHDVVGNDAVGLSFRLQFGKLYQAAIGTFDDHVHPAKCGSFRRARQAPRRKRVFTSTTTLRALRQ